jgi:hypothetical protein
MCDIKTLTLLKNYVGGNSAVIIDKYYEQIVNIKIKYLNTEYNGKISSSTIIMYLSSLIGLSCDKCKFYLNENGKLCDPTDKIYKYLNKNSVINNQEELTLNCITNTNYNLNLNKIVKLFINSKELNSDINCKRIYSINGSYMKFTPFSSITTHLGSNLEFHLNITDEIAKEFIRRKMSSHILLKVDGKTVSFNYKWMSDSIVIIPLLYIGSYEVIMKPMILDRETEKILNISTLESFIYEEFYVM